jgi:fermentation-respiration switch protein FrsA (DUF1100 family)
MGISRAVSLAVLGVTIVVQASVAAEATTQSTETCMLRGQPQTVRLYGARGAGTPVIVSSGDGGWVHLAPHVAEALAARGYFVVGFDVKAYLESFTSKEQTLRVEDEPGDYRALADFAARGSVSKPILIGVSEGAGLSVLAATDPKTKDAIGGVIGLGLPDLNELGWRWRDSIIYVTHGVPKEPTFSAAALVNRVSPLPLAAIHSTSDEFVPVAAIERMMALAGEPKRLWVLTAADHRFSDKLSELDEQLVQALQWVKQTGTR